MVPSKLFTSKPFPQDLKLLKERSTLSLRLEEDFLKLNFCEVLYFNGRRIERHVFQIPILKMPARSETFRSGGQVRFLPGLPIKQTLKQTALRVFLFQCRFCFRVALLCPEAIDEGDLLQENRISW